MTSFDTLTLELKERMQTSRRKAIINHHDKIRTGIIIKEIDEK
jgi:hypothetical protein